MQRPGLVVVGAMAAMGMACMGGREPDALTPLDAYLPGEGLAVGEASYRPGVQGWGEVQLFDELEDQQYGNHVVPAWMSKAAEDRSIWAHCRVDDAQDVRLEFVRLEAAVSLGFAEHECLTLTDASIEGLTFGDYYAAAKGRWGEPADKGTERATWLLSNGFPKIELVVTNSAAKVSLDAKDQKCLMLIKSARATGVGLAGLMNEAPECEEHWKEEP